MEAGEDITQDKVKHRNPECFDQIVESVDEEKQLIADMEPQQRLARPLLVVVPENYPTAHEECAHAKQ